MVGAWLTLSVVGPIVVLFVVFRSSLDPWLCSITEVLVICVSLWCFTDEVRDSMQAEHIFVIWRCNRIQSKIARVNPISSSLATVPRQCLYCSNCASVVSYLAFVFPFLVSPFLESSGRLCFAIVAFPGYMYPSSSIFMLPLNGIPDIWNYTI